MTQTPQPGTVYLVDDDPSVLKGLSRLLRSADLVPVAFDSPVKFLAHDVPDQPSCLILDMTMPGLNGLALQEKLQARGSLLPILFLTGNGTISGSVQAMKGGAVDFLTKPVDDRDLLRAVDGALRRHAQLLEQKREREALLARFASLTPREYEVMTRIISGALNKQVADNLGTVEKTIKVHRARVMEKMGVHSIAELVRLAGQAGIAPVAVE